MAQSPAGATQRQWVGQPGEWPAEPTTAEAAESGRGDLRDPRRWGLSADARAPVGARRYEFWRRVRDGVTTRTRDPRANASTSLRGQLSRDHARNLANRARHLTGDDGHALQHCMSNAPWAGQAVFGQLPAEIKATAALAPGSTLILDERADEQAGTHHAGASRQDNGRMGTVDRCRVDTCLTEANGGLWAMGDGDLCVPEEGLGEACAQTRHERGLPPARTFETKIAWGVTMVTRVTAHGVPCDLVACDALYGRDSLLRADVATAGGLDAAPVPADTHVSVSAPHVGVPEKRGKRGRPRTRLHGLSRQRPHEVRALARAPQTVWPQVGVRQTARGRVAADVAVPRLWPVAVGQRPRAEWVGIRRDAEGHCSSTRLNAPEAAPHARLLAWSWRRYVIDRTCEDAQTAIGWDAFQAQTYRAGEPPLARTGWAWWCVAQTKVAWAQA